MLRCLVIACAASLVLAVPAAAYDRGVIVDPGSPSAKEYALPLDSVRKAALGSAEGPVGIGASSYAPIFGVGIRRTRLQTPSSSGRRAPSRPGTGPPTSTPSPGALEAIRRLEKAPRESALSEPPLLMTLALLAAAGLGGLALSRRLRR